MSDSAIEAHVPGRSLSADNRGAGDGLRSSGLKTGQGLPSFSSILAGPANPDRARAFNEDGLFARPLPQREPASGAKSTARANEKSGKIANAKTSLGVDAPDINQKNLPLSEKMGNVVSNSAPEKQYAVRATVMASNTAAADDTIVQNRHAVSPGIADVAHGKSSGATEQNAAMASRGSPVGPKNGMAMLAQLHAQRAHMPVQVVLQNLETGVRLIAAAKNLSETEKQQMRRAVTSVLAQYGIYSFDFELNGETFAGI